MSLTSRLALGTSIVVSSAIIIYVHYKQQYDRDQLRLGVVKDLERQNRRKIENTYILQQQQSLEKHLRKELSEKEKNVQGHQIS